MPLLEIHPNRWMCLVRDMLYRIYVVRWELAEEDAKYMNQDKALSAAASSCRNPGYSTQSVMQMLM
jgi:hypothetical protein